MTREFLFKAAAESDEKAIKEILKACQLPDEDINKLLLEHFWVIYKEGKMVGTIGLEVHYPHGLLRSLAVSAPYRNQGLGSKLISGIEAHARRQGLSQIYLLTTTAKNLFSKFDYSIIDRVNVPSIIQATDEFKTLCPDSAVCMFKRI